jgi:DNA-binding LytR/AlgR family response regulator
MINCIAIDDEPLALKQIVAYIKKTPSLELAGQFESALQAMEFLSEHPVDLMFVDINMPDLNGMDFVKALDNPPKVIFTTAYSEYALEGFQVNAVDYLLKPIGYLDFLKSANKPKALFESHPAPNEEVKIKNDSLFIKSEYKIIRIELDKIRYIEGDRGYLRFFLENAKPVMTLLSMKKMLIGLLG